MLIVCNIYRHDCWSGATATNMPVGVVQLCLTAHWSDTIIGDMNAGLRQV